MQTLTRTLANIAILIGTDSGAAAQTAHRRPGPRNHRALVQPLHRGQPERR